MTSYLAALAAMTLALSVLMMGAWVVQQRTGNSGWVDAIWTFSVGLVGADTALWMRRWRFLATAGFFGFSDGSERGVSHYRMRAAQRPA
jgi:steroid 5-alpha reductase family enzyme